MLSIPSEVVAVAMDVVVVVVIPGTKTTFWLVSHRKWLSGYLFFHVQAFPFCKAY